MRVVRHRCLGRAFRGWRPSREGPTFVRAASALPGPATELAREAWSNPGFEPEAQVSSPGGGVGSGQYLRNRLPWLFFCYSTAGSGVVARVVVEGSPHSVL